MSILSPGHRDAGHVRVNELSRTNSQLYPCYPKPFLDDLPYIWIAMPLTKLGTLISQRILGIWTSFLLLIHSPY